MICAKCGTEYEGSQCPKCDGPVIKINNSDYLARRKAYEEKQAKLKRKEVPGKDRTDRIDKTEKKDKKIHASKSKNYDEGVFDITKVDMNQVADKLKKGRDVFAGSKDRFAKSLEKNAKKNNKQADENTGIKIRKADSSGIPYKKAGIAAAVILILIAVVVFTVDIITKKNYNIYMSDGSKIYDVSSLDSRYVCDKSGAIFALDDDTFFTPEWPEGIDKDNSVLNVSSPKGSYFATDVYDSAAGMYTLYIWSDDVCPSASRPQQLTKCVCSMPSCPAFSFILSTKTSSEPHMYSDMATHASLALATAIHFIIVLTLCISPSSKNTWLPPIEAACSETVTGSSIFICPLSNASNISISVIILVMLAGASCFVASFSYIIWPVLDSISIADGVSISGPAMPAVTMSDSFNSSSSAHT